MSELRYWLWLSALQGLTPRAAKTALYAFPSVTALYFATEKDLKRVPGLRPSELRALCGKDISIAEGIEENCRKQDIRMICLPDAAYPARLRNIDDPPLVLYVKGNLPPVDDRLCIGIVGTRKASSYGRDMAGRIAGEIAASGGIIVTGLAEGIDSAAAKGALKAHGTVIAVLGTGVDRVYPAMNVQLQSTVAKVGALVSEYPPGIGPTKISFPRRNRIISGLSLGVTVVQAPEKSGALITAGFAQEQGRDVFVVPGAVDDLGFIGSNDLIRDGAQLVRGSEDILEEYAFRYPELLPKRRLRESFRSPEATKEAIDKAGSLDYSSLSEQLEGMTEQELSVVGALSEGPAYADELIHRSGVSAADAMAALTMLQLKGFVREEEGRFRLLVRYDKGRGR